MAEIRLKLSDLFASFSDTKHRSITPLADSLFARGWSLERGISGTQDFQAAAQIYRQAAARGSLEALYRLGWLVENEFIIEHIQTADQLYQQAMRVVIESRKASASLLQRRLKVGYARAARLLDLMEQNGVIGPVNGAKAREIFVNE